MQLTKNIFVETKIGGCNVGYVLTLSLIHI